MKLRQGWGNYPFEAGSEVALNQQCLWHKKKSVTQPHRIRTNWTDFTNRSGQSTLEPFRTTNLNKDNHFMPNRISTTAHPLCTAWRSSVSPKFIQAKARFQIADDNGISPYRQNGSFCREVNGTENSGIAIQRGGKGSEQILLALRGGIRWARFRSWNWPKGTH